MKKMTCAQMGGSCEAEIMGATMEEMMANGGMHMKEAHPEAAAAMDAMPQEEKDKWMADMKAKWDATPESEM